MKLQEKHQICVWERVTENVWTMYLPFSAQAQLYHTGGDIYKLVCCTLGIITLFSANDVDDAKRESLIQIRLSARYKAKRLLRLASELEEE